MIKELDAVKDILADYYNVTLPDSMVSAIVESDPELEQEIKSGAAYDTYVRELLISAVGRYLEIKVPVPNIFGVVGSHEWPCYGDTDEYKEAFYKEFNGKLVEIER